MKAESKNIFLTGMTGTLGKRLLETLLRETEDNLFLLVRPAKKLSAEERVRKFLASCGLEHCLGARVHVLEGDITEPGLGLSPAALDRLMPVEAFFHVAALTALNGSREDCFKINLGGTREALSVASLMRREGNLRRFYYFSTAFVAGSRQTYHAPEDGLPGKPAHANHYEASKYHAEGEVRRAMAEGLPAVIFRPSIVVGDSRTGEVSDFNVIYPFMRLYAHGMLSKLPTKPDNSFNIVPIDFVVEAALAIAARPDCIGKTFHLVTRQPPAIRALLEVGREELPNLPEVEIIPPETFRRDRMEVNEQMVYDMLEPYLGYLNDHLTFDTTNTENALAGTGISFPRTDKEFLRTLVRYAIKSGYILV